MSKQTGFLSILCDCNTCRDDVFSRVDSLVSVVKDNFESFEFVFAGHNLPGINQSDSVKQFVERHKVTAIFVEMSSDTDHERAMIAAADAAIGDFLLEIEQIPVGYGFLELPEAMDKCLSGNDIVSVHPKSRSSVPVSRHVFAGIAYRLIKHATHDMAELYEVIFRIVTRRLYYRVKAIGDKAIYRKFVYEIVDLPHARIFVTGKSTQLYARGFFTDVFFFMDIMLKNSDFGPNLAICISFVMMLVSIASAGYAIYSYIVRSGIQSGWTSLVLLLSLAFTGMFFLLGLVLRYLLILTRERRPYLYLTKKPPEKYKSK